MAPELKEALNPAAELTSADAEANVLRDGRPKNVGSLVINADDWGRDLENTSRTLDCIRRGSVSSVSAMVFMEDSERAAEIARERKIDAGLHLNFTTAFSAPGVPRKLADHQQRLLACLLGSRFASVVFYPHLANSFAYVTAAQFEEYSRLYGKAPERIDGHHHMHLCANVLMGKLIPDGSIVRRNFSFQAGEKGFANRLYRSWIDKKLSRWFRLMDFFFSIEPVDAIERLQRIVSLAGQFNVEVETHPVNAKEYRFLLSTDLDRALSGIAVAPRFDLPMLPQTTASRDLALRTVRSRNSKPDVSRPTVLVGFAEAASAPEVVWSLVDAGCDVVAFARRGRASALRHSRHVRCHEICAPETNLATCIAELGELLSTVFHEPKDTKRVLLPLDDKAVLLCSQVTLDNGWILAGPEGPQAQLALRKSLQVEAARAAGFNVPQTIVTKIKSAIKEFAADIQFPIILKSAECVSTDGIRTLGSQNWICASEGELERALSAWNESVPLLVQPFIRGIGEGVFGFAAREEVRAWSGHRRLRMMNPQGSGSSACISQSVPEDLKQKAEDFLERIGWQGMFMIELLRDASGKVWFIEFNGRSWGSMALSRGQGLEYPAWQVALAIDPDSQAGVGANPKPGMVARNAGRDFMHLLFILRGPKSAALAGWPSFWSSLAEIIRPNHSGVSYNWRADDWKVFTADTWATIRSNLFKTKN